MGPMKYLGTNGMCCTKGAEKPLQDLDQACSMCNQRLRIVDARYGSLYGFCEITLRRLSLVTGQHFHKNAQPRLTTDYQKDTTRSYGLLPSQVHTEIFDRPDGKLVSS